MCQTTDISFEAIVTRSPPVNTSHCFSACLYHEAEFALRFPKRDFKARYLERMSQVKALFERRNYHLRLFVDEAMLETALGFDFGDLYLVRGAPAFPFAQHLMRYYAVLLPDHERFACHHFRGLDNLLVDKPESRLLHRFGAGSADLLHAPYLRRNGEVYTPVRGSCSVAREGAKALAYHLRTVPQIPPGPWPEGWHSDEVYLARFFQWARPHLSLHTLVDRNLPMDFYFELSLQIKTGRPLELTRLCL